MNFTDEIPDEFTDEERWLKIFPKKVFIALLVCVGTSFFITKLINLLFGIFWVPLIICVIISAVIIFAMCISRDESDYLRGGGQSYMSLWLKKSYRKKHRCLYCRGVNWRDY